MRPFTIVSAVLLFTGVFLHWHILIVSAFLVASVIALVTPDEYKNAPKFRLTSALWLSYSQLPRRYELTAM